VTTNGLSATAYVDGTSLGTQTLPTPLDTAPHTPLIVGAPVWQSSGVIGNLDELAIFPSVLSKTQIGALDSTATAAVRRLERPRLGGAPVRIITPVHATSRGRT